MQNFVDVILFKTDDVNAIKAASSDKYTGSQDFAHISEKIVCVLVTIYNLYTE